MQGWTASRLGPVARSRMLLVAREDPLEGSSLFDAAAEPPMLKALLRMSDAVLRADYFDDVLDVIAEQALSALNAASLSISRWDPQHGTLQTLINVGELAPDEQRWPRDEYYFVADDPLVTELLQNGRSYTNAVDDPDCPADCRRLLLELGKECELAVPVMYGHSMWGEIWASGTAGRRFDGGDARLLQAVSAHIAVAIGRAELLSTVWGYALQDPLTGIANRRAIDQLLAEIDWETATPVALACDLDGFKQINDRDGHPAGDALLRGVASVLERLTGEIDGAVAARMGGDEFCVFLPDATLAAAQVYADDATKVIRGVVDTGISLSWGAAAAGPDIRNGQDLLAAADAALLEAKRQGPATFSTGVATTAVPGGIDWGDRRTGDRGDIDQLAGIIVEIMERRTELTVPAALEILAMQVQQAINAAAWAISVRTDDGTALHTVLSLDSVLKQDSGLTVLTHLGPTVYELSDYPVSAKAVAEGTAFVTAVGLEGSDPAEIALLEELGYQAGLGVGVRAGERRYLLEFFSHEGYAELAATAPHVLVLAAYCVSRATAG